MSEQASDAGLLVLVVGPSGVGKDTLLEAARAALGADLVFVRREVTRPMSAGGEDHLSVDRETFAARRRAGAYALSWCAHGLGYGVPRAIEHEIAAGRTVIVNASRGVLDDARRRFPGLRVVSVVARPDVLRERLLRRGRENEAEIETRVARAVAFDMQAPDVLDVPNDGSIEDGVAAFIAALTRLNAGRQAQAAEPSSAP